MHRHVHVDIHCDIVMGTLHNVNMYMYIHVHVYLYVHVHVHVHVHLQPLGMNVYTAYTHNFFTSSFFFHCFPFLFLLLLCCIYMYIHVYTFFHVQYLMYTTCVVGSPPEDKPAGTGTDILGDYH